METNRLNNFKNHLEQYKEKFTVINEDNLITATSVKFTEPTIEEKELELIKFHQQMLKNNNIQLMNKFKETKRNEIKKYKESHRKKEFNKPITPYRQEIINTLKNPANGFNLALTLNFNPVNLSGLFNLQMVQNKVDEWWKLYCAYTLGRDASKYKTMNYIGFVEHFESNKISRIDKSTQNIIPFMSYVNGTLLEVFKDIQIISDYFRLVSWNYTLCAEEVIVTTKYSDTPFSILYCLPFLEIKKYEVNINNLPTYVQRNKVFLKNDNYLLPIKNFFENYSNLGNCIFLLNENHYSKRFTSLYLGRTIDALAAIARYKQINKSEKYQKVLNLFFESYPNIIKKIDKILENVKCSDLQENDTKDIIRGKKISTLRTQIVHFDFSKDKHLPNIEKVIKLMEIFECLICDFIFEIINVDEEVRSSLLKQQENLCLSHRLPA